MADTGFLFPGTAVGNRAITGGDRNWINTDNIKADDTSDATWFSISANEQSNGLAASNFDFSGIPAGSTIDGIEVRVGDYSGSSNSVFTWDVLRLILADDSDGSVNRNTDLTAPTTSDQTDGS